MSIVAEIQRSCPLAYHAAKLAAEYASPEEYEAYKYIEELFKRKIFTWDWERDLDTPFSRTIAAELAEGYKSPAERPFVCDLVAQIEQRWSHSPTLEFAEAMPAGLLTHGSCAMEMQRPCVPLLGMQKREIYHVRLCLGQETCVGDPLALMEDANGVWSLGKLSLHRKLFHEILHQYHKLVNPARDARVKVESLRWSNGEEEDTIAAPKYSENAFARARGEGARLSHMAWLPTTKEEEFLLAIKLGADGTVQRLMAEYTARRTSLMAMDMLISATTQAMEVLTRDVRSILGPLRQRLMREHGVQDLFDCDAVPVGSMIYAFETTPEKVFDRPDAPKATTQDRAFFAEIEERKKKLLQTLANTLTLAGQFPKAEELLKWSIAKKEKEIAEKQRIKQLCQPQLDALAAILAELEQMDSDKSGA